MKDGQSSFSSRTRRSNKFGRRLWESSQTMERVFEHCPGEREPEMQRKRGEVAHLVVYETHD